MAAFIKENTQFVDIAGVPLSNGKLYIGVNGSDPVANPKSIFSDRNLSVALANPQTLNTFGESTNKIWIDGKYSLQVNNSNAVQKFQDLDAGETTESGITSLSNIQGINTVTADAATTITAYVDKEIYILTLGSAPTGAMTLNIDSVGAKSVVKDGQQPIVEGDAAANSIWAVAYNSTNDNFELQSDTSQVVNFYEGTPVVSAATTDIWATDGDTIHITGSVACTSFGTAPHIGARRTLIYDDAVALTNSTNLHLQGEADYTTSAGDILEVYADILTQFDVIIYPVDGSAVGVPQATQAALEAETNEDTYAPPDLIKHSPGVAKAWASFTAAVVINASQGISSITDQGVGDWSPNLSTAMSSAEYAVGGLTGSAGNPGGTGGIRIMVENESRTKSTTQFHVAVYTGETNPAPVDPADDINVFAFGDQ